ncbi:MAG: ComEC/Rec2 family competence protein [Chitinophagales bacterium]
MKNLFHSQIWKEAPFFRLLIPLAAGILLQYFLPITKSFNGLILICSALVLIFSLFLPLNASFGWSWMMGLAIQLAFLSLGRLLMISRQDVPVSFGNIPPGNGLLIAKLENEPVKKSGSFKSLASIQGLCYDQRYYLEREKIIIYFRATHLPVNLRTGSLIIFSKTLNPVKNSDFFGGFDYRHYCRLKHIYSQVFLGVTDFSLLGEESEGFFRSCLTSWRKKLLKILKQHIPGPAETSLMEALMIGYTEDLDRSLLQSYSDTGVVHIIAISGLHLALIYQILQLLLKRIKTGKSGKWLKLVILLSSLWIFSLLTGASPSVIRSAVMFSIILLAKNLSRESIVYNSLASSAFLLLCYDPLWLWDTGFQLSYMAVLSLVIFLKPIQGLLNLRNRLLAGLWNAASVSLAAQVLTTPISIYYFHRFPNYFLISNLLAVPLSGCILIGGILLCLFSFSPLIANDLGWLLDKGIGFLNGFIQYIARLPGAITDQLTENGWQVVILYFLIYAVYNFLKTGGKKWMVSALIFTCFFLLVRIFTY